MNEILSQRSSQADFSCPTCGHTCSLTCMGNPLPPCPLPRSHTGEQKVSPPLSFHAFPCLYKAPSGVIPRVSSQRVRVEPLGVWITFA